MADKALKQKITVDVTHVRYASDFHNEGLFYIRVDSDHYIRFEITLEIVDKIPNFNPIKLYKNYNQYMSTVTYIVLHGVGCRL